MRLGPAEAASWREAPLADEVEVSVFGPGKGESLVCHLGSGRWMVIDSCIDRDTSQPVALDYLEALRVDAGTQLEIVAATHWHDDHIRGLADVVAAATNSTFHFSMALQTHNFLTLVKAIGTRPMMEKPGALEFARIIGLLEQRVQAEGREHAPQPAVAHTLLWRPSSNGADRWTGASRVEALSPSPRSVQLGLEEIGQLLPEAYAVKRRVTAVSPNHTSLVTLAVLGDAVALLGGDLQETGASVHGWSEIISSTRRPTERASAIKLAHHGADNADHPGIWTELLTEGPIAALTPYNRGITPRPSSTDTTRICGNTTSAYMTTERPEVTRRRRDTHTERLLRARPHAVRSASGAMGQVRMRRPLNGEAASRWDIELFAAASSLCANAGRDGS
jgi:hypothetical protein